MTTDDDNDTNNDDKNAGEPSMMMDFCLTEHPSPCSVDHYYNCPPVFGLAYIHHRSGGSNDNNNNKYPSSSSNSFNCTSANSLDSLNYVTKQQYRPNSCPSSVNRRINSSSNRSIGSCRLSMSGTCSPSITTTSSSNSGTTSHKCTASAAVASDMMSSDRFIPVQGCIEF